MIQGENISILMAKVFLYKSRGDQFLYNRNWDLSWFWAGWQYWKKTGPNMSNFWRQFFFMFSWTKTFIILLKDIAAFTLKSCIKWRWKKMWKKKLNRLQKYFQLCLGLLRDTPLHNLSIMTLCICGFLWSLHKKSWRVSKFRHSYHHLATIQDVTLIS